jgi:hypothetical protein
LTIGKLLAIMLVAAIFFAIWRRTDIGSGTAFTIGSLVPLWIASMIYFLDGR